MLHIPNLYFSIKCPHWEIITSIYIRPGDWSDLIEIAHIGEFCNTSFRGIPNIYRSSERNCKLIRLGPVNKIEVEVITKIGCIKHSERLLSYLSFDFSILRRVDFAALAVFKSQATHVVTEWRQTVFRRLTHRMLKRDLALFELEQPWLGEDRVRLGLGISKVELLVCR